MTTVNADEILDKTNSKTNIGTSMPTNTNWLRTAFADPGNDDNDSYFDVQERYNSVFNSAVLKFTDSSLGGNNCINPLPQYTRYSDIKVRSLSSVNSTRMSVDNALEEETFAYNTKIGVDNSTYSTPKGMGGDYSTYLDDSAQVIHLRFGVKQYNDMLSFWTGFYNSKAGYLVRTGRYDDSIINLAAEKVGKLIGLAASPLLLLPFAFNLIGTASKFFLSLPMSKYYNMKPTMPMYWSAVQNILNMMTTYQGITSPKKSDLATKWIGNTKDFTEGSDQASEENSILSDLFNEYSSGGVFDVYKIILRSKINHLRFENNLANMLKKANESINATGDDAFAQYAEAVTKNMSTNSLLNRSSTYTNQGDRFSLGSWLLNYTQKLKEWVGVTTGDGKTLGGAIEKSPLASSNDPNIDKERNLKLKNGFSEYYISAEDDGLEWLSLRVDYTGSVSESFSNSTAESAVASTYNSTSSNFKSFQFSSMGGNVANIPGVETVTSALGSFFRGVIDGINIGGAADGIIGLFTGSKVDIPKDWDSSSMNLSRSNYTMTLISPYGNPISQVINIYFPLACLLAAALPRATGKQSYDSPFLCQLHDRGRSMTRLGMIDSLSITRGTSNLGFNKLHKALAVDVSFSIVDLSSIMAVPIRYELSDGLLDGLFDHENILVDYMMAMSGTTLGDAIYRPAMLAAQLKTLSANIQTSYLSSAAWGVRTASTGTGLINALMRGTARN